MTLHRNTQEHQGSKGLTAIDCMILLTHWLTTAKKTLGGDAKWKYFERTDALITSDGSGDDLLNSMENPRMRSSKS